MQRQQQGLTLISFIIVAAIVGLLFIVGMKIVPTITEYRAIQKAVQYAADNGDGDNRRIQFAFERQKAIDYFTAVGSNDIIIGKFNNQTTVGFDYVKDIPLMDNVSLRIHYKGEAKSKVLK
ncbi:DUF4845 domain-containing protein [Ampullimonas aquatilis]|uniref:DUF4845 domain-containing protein n=1 Tax=Ampullimonas aquatilis TaxID=1341549 RepID=UPI003C75E9F3